jgi:molybdopterin-containing oxidoreductase family iron-sulfur binding subunit
VFGNANNAQSAIAKTRVENDNRIYFALEDIHTMPNVNYLAKVRNTHEISNEGVLERGVEQPGAAPHGAEHKG